MGRPKKNREIEEKTQEQAVPAPETETDGEKDASRLFSAQEVQEMIAKAKRGKLD